MAPHAQGNLKHAGQAAATFPEFVTDLPATDLHIHLEQYCQQERFQILSFISPELVQPGLLDLRNIQVGGPACMGPERTRAWRPARSPPRPREPGPPIARAPAARPQKSTGLPLPSTGIEVYI
jgi:hypothetical protein